jgi:hypothetical protein
MVVISTMTLRNLFSFQAIAMDVRNVLCEPLRRGRDK